MAFDEGFQYQGADKTAIGVHGFADGLPDDVCALVLTSELA